MVACAGDATYTATYKATYIDYTVIFVDEDGTVLSTKTYHWGDKVTAPADPTKAADNTYTYTFAGWDKEVVACAGNATYTATYKPTFIDYTVVFKNWDGTILSSKTYHWGDKVTAPKNPTKAADKTYTYTFAGWDKDVVNCAGNATYTATYTSVYIDYTVTFKNWDGTVLSTKTYHYGDKVTAPANPTRPDDDENIYTFAGWDKEVVSCTGDATYTATYAAEPHAPKKITSDRFTVRDGFVSKIQAGTTIAQIKAGITQKSIKILKDGKEVQDTALAGTGMVIQLIANGKVADEVTMIVTGDTNGDGKITVTDMIAVKSHILKKSTLTGASAKAANTSADNAISITDFIQIKAHILGKSQIVPASAKQQPKETQPQMTVTKTEQKVEQELAKTQIQSVEFSVRGKENSPHTVNWLQKKKIYV